MDDLIIDYDKKDTELDIDIDIDKIISSLNEPDTYKSEITEPLNFSKKELENFIIEKNNNYFILINKNKDIFIYTIIFIILNIKVPLLNIDNFYLNIILKTIIFIICLYCLKKYNIVK